MQKKIVIASDHAGFRVKEAVKRHLQGRGLVVEDCGADSDASVDYPDMAAGALRALAAGEAGCGVLVCGSGVGMSIVANRVPGIRAALASDPRTAEMCKKHNDANVLVLPGWRLSREETAAILDAWLDASFEGGRHQRRLEKVEAVARAVRAGTEDPQ